MPSTKIKTSGGTFKFNYTISTPSSTSAKAIDKRVPTVVLLHPVYLGQVLFHPQFSDPSLRRFNLVAIDFRGHGETVGAINSPFGPMEGAADLFKIMEDLKLPASHIIGVSMGCSIALEFAISRPNKVLSLALVSPLPFVEPQEITEGRREIHQYWREGWANPKKPDHEALGTAVRGALQLAFNNQESTQISAIIKVALPQLTRLYGPGLLDGHRIVTADFFEQPRSHTTSTLGNIICPVLLIHLNGDIAYEFADTNRICESLQHAGVNATITVANDFNVPHYGCMTHPQIVNPIIHDFIVSHLEAPAPPIPIAVTSPYEAMLKKAGWEDNDSDTEFV